MAGKKKISKYFIYFFGAFGGILFGYDIGVMTGSLPFLQQDFSVILNDAFIKGWVNSAVMFGAIFGGAISGIMADRIGRRKVIIIAAILFALGSIACAFTPMALGVAVIIAARVVLGLAVGAASALVPSYMSEMAPSSKRGMLSSMNQVMIVSGMLISYIVDFFVGGFCTGGSIDQTTAWRIMLGAAALPAIVLFLGMIRLPESPRFLVRKGKIDEAKQVLSYIRKPDEVDIEIREIETVVNKEKTMPKISWSALFADRYRMLVIAGVGVAALQQFQGANAIFYYIPLIVQDLGIAQATDSNALMWPIVQGVILVLGALFGLTIVDRFRRRTLLTLGGLVMACSFIAPSIINTILSAGGVTGPQGYIVIACLSLYVAFYSFTWAGLTWVLVGEIFPLAIRGRASGLASSFNWIGSFAVGLLFPVMAAAIPQEGVFMIFGAICLFGVFFVRKFVPETRGKSLEEIENQMAIYKEVVGKEVRETLGDSAKTKQK